MLVCDYRRRKIGRCWTAHQGNISYTQGEGESRAARLFVYVNLKVVDTSLIVDQKKSNSLNILLQKFSQIVIKWSGGSWAFLIALGIVIVWAITGPVFGFSNTWQLVINTGTTIVTFLMVFLIQRAQNKDGIAIQLKLNEIIASVEGASNRLIDVEDLTEEELETLHKHYQKLARMCKHESDLRKSHSIEEAEVRHKTKAKKR